MAIVLLLLLRAPLNYTMLVLPLLDAGSLIHPARLLALPLLVGLSDALLDELSAVDAFLRNVGDGCTLCRNSGGGGGGYIQHLRGD